MSDLRQQCVHHRSCRYDGCRRSGCFHPKKAQGIESLAPSCFGMLLEQESMTYK